MVGCLGLCWILACYDTIDSSLHWCILWCKQVHKYNAKAIKRLQASTRGLWAHGRGGKGLWRKIIHFVAAKYFLIISPPFFPWFWKCFLETCGLPLTACGLMHIWEYMSHNFLMEASSPFFLPTFEVYHVYVTMIASSYNCRYSSKL